MTLHVRLFGRYRDLAREGAVAVALPAGSTVADLVAALHDRDDGVLPARPVVAVNQRPAAYETVLSSSDDIALIPPVSGG